MDKSIQKEAGASTMSMDDIVGSHGSLDPIEEMLSADDFKRAFRDLAAGIAVITATADGEKAAMTATSVASLSATPPLLSFSASQLSSATAVVGRADTVVVHILSEDQLDLAKLCSTSGVDRFADAARWSVLETGEPYYPEAPVWIRGRVVNRFSAGASIVHIVEALQSNLQTPDGVAEDVKPLVYHNRTWHSLNADSTLT